MAIQISFFLDIGGLAIDLYYLIEKGFLFVVKGFREGFSPLESEEIERNAKKDINKKGIHVKKLGG